MMREKVVLVLVLVAAVAVLGATPAGAQGGPEQTATFLKTVEGTVKAISEAKAQLEKTVATYNSITEMTAKDLKGAYKDLGKDVASSEEKVAACSPRVDAMNNAARGYFGAWEASAAAISDPVLRKRSEERLADARAQFEKIAAAGAEARQSYDVLIKDVKDQYTFLGHDLNPGAIESLKPDAARFNDRASTVFKKVDGVTGMYGEYVASMKP